MLCDKVEGMIMLEIMELSPKKLFILRLFIIFVDVLIKD
ncbi:hypothetical protein AC094_05820 [Bacteroides fragilis]|uniref:Uncharacterized protein n=1 Tax=Bacteroides fragilis TaxID=817 RepID=A0A853Q225_BACFG|nr:hypothetical protein M075_0561 [Bacteroides fragilis str. 20793-3]OCR36267.1 hypothetical protein AC094_05820 [Bacteroides fragilis]